MENVSHSTVQSTIFVVKSFPATNKTKLHDIISVIEAPIFDANICFNSFAFQMN